MQNIGGGRWLLLLAGGAALAAAPVVAQQSGDPEQAAAEDAPLDTAAQAETVAPEAVQQEPAADEAVPPAGASATPEAGATPDAETAADAETADDAEITDDAGIADDAEATVDATGETPAETGTFIEQRNFNRLFTAGDYEAAADSAKRLVVLAIEQQGAGSMEAARALTQLGITQREAGDLEASRENFAAAIEAIEANTDRLAKDLIAPLHGLGRTHLKDRRPDAAAEALERAVHVSQVNEGPQNLEQVGLLNELSEAYYQLGDFKQADALQRYTVGLYQRQYPEDDDQRILPALYQRAQWLNRMGLFVREQAVYNQIIRIIERSDGRDSMKLIPALSGLARTYVYVTEDDARARGERSLRRAVSIAKKNEDTPTELKADTEITLGDYFNLIGERTSARRAYRRAWRLLDTDELADLTVRDDRFGEPHPISQIDPQPDSPLTGDLAEFAAEYGSDPRRGYVVVSYTVNRRGRIEDPEVIESIPAGFRDDDALAWVRRFVYRPRMEDAKTVDTPGVTFRYEFEYYPAEVERETGQPIDAGEDTAE
ncbi:MAG: TonB family protein [Pseudomonadota bacterium]